MTNKPKEHCQFYYKASSPCRSDGPFFMVKYGSSDSDFVISCRLHIIDLSPPHTTLQVIPCEFN